MSDGTGSEWGRVADDGTVYVRTSEGERAVGSWRAGSPDEGLAHFVRRYDDLPPSLHAYVDHELPFEPRADGKPRLDDAEIDDIVAFLGTLTDADLAH